jgi:hypothetical protein
MMAPPALSGGAPSPVVPRAIREVERAFWTSSGWTLGRSTSTVRPVQRAWPDPGLRRLRQSISVTPGSFRLEPQAVRVPTRGADGDD